MIPTESRMREIRTSGLTIGGEETRFMVETEALAGSRKPPANCYSLDLSTGAPPLDSTEANSGVGQELTTAREPDFMKELGDGAGIGTWVSVPAFSAGRKSVQGVPSGGASSFLAALKQADAVDVEGDDAGEAISATGHHPVELLEVVDRRFHRGMPTAHRNQLRALRALPLRRIEIPLLRQHVVIKQRINRLSGL